jgi:hypothetical protein
LWFPEGCDDPDLLPFLPDHVARLLPQNPTMFRLLARTCMGRGGRRGR